MLDADSDGDITQEEYNAGFGILDSDGDGFLCRKEFGVKALAHFDMLDADQDGKVTKQEYEVGWSLFDTDNDGHIDKRSWDLVLVCVFLYAFVWCGVQFACVCR